MVDGLFCATLKGRRGDHTPFVQERAETSDTGAKAVEPDPGPGRSVIRRGKSFSLHSKKHFCLGGAGFFVSDVISGRLLGHLGLLCLALGANH